MKKAQDLSGLKFGMLTVVERSGSMAHNTMWLCECGCGKTTVVSRGNLLNGHSKSCGCLRHKPSTNRTHGESKSRLYYVWRNMLNRCYNEKVNDFHNYGGRGIVVCDEWKDSFEAFRNWAIANGYAPDANRGYSTIDRIDADGNYEPANCRWVDAAEQANNKRSNRIVHYDGKPMTIKQLSMASGIPYKTLYKRICILDWDIDSAVNTKVR